MKKTISIILIIALLLGGLLFLTACGNKKETVAEDETTYIEPTIIGTWKNDELGYDFVYTFRDDGTGSYNAAGTKMKFTYEINDNQISILYEGDTMPFETEFEIDGSRLNIKDSFGEDTIYKKVKY